MPPGLRTEGHALLLRLLQESGTCVLIRQACCDLFSLLIKLLAVFLRLPYSVLALQGKKPRLRVVHQIVADSIQFQACFLCKRYISPPLGIGQHTNSLLPGISQGIADGRWIKGSYCRCIDAATFNLASCYGRYDWHISFSLSPCWRAYGCGNGCRFFLGKRIPVTASHLVSAVSLKRSCQQG